MTAPAVLWFPDKFFFVFSLARTTVVFIRHIPSGAHSPRCRPFNYRGNRYRRSTHSLQAASSAPPRILTAWSARSSVRGTRALGGEAERLVQLGAEFPSAAVSGRHEVQEKVPEGNASSTVVVWYSLCFLSDNISCMALLLTLLV